VHPKTCASEQHQQRSSRRPRLLNRPSKRQRRTARVSCASARELPPATGWRAGDCVGIRGPAGHFVSPGFGENRGFPGPADAGLTREPSELRGQRRIARLAPCVVSGRKLGTTTDVAKNRDTPSATARAQVLVRAGCAVRCRVRVPARRRPRAWGAGPMRADRVQRPGCVALGGAVGVRP
jgi:hypothetical protein